MYHLIIIGGGAAGFFAALAAKRARPNAAVLILEKSSQLLSKVRISGGGRCNVTHACFDPLALSKNYPRGEKALIGPFTRFQPKDTIEWFSSRGVELKAENDGRMFPVTDNSQTIIDCLLKEAQNLKIEIRLKQNILKVEKNNSHFMITLDSGETLLSTNLLLATGSHPQGYLFAKSFNHTIQDPVPSLFTFNVPSSLYKELAGISVPNARVEIHDSSLIQTGPLLITHWGFSGPAILKLSAWGARILHEKKYSTPFSINWVSPLSQKETYEMLITFRKKHPLQNLSTINPFSLPKNLWKTFLNIQKIEENSRYTEISNSHLQNLSQQLCNDIQQMQGKTTHKEEFVTCGGVLLNEIHFKTMESKLQKGLFFAGEILDIDGITGGFNFQNAWTTGWIAGNSLGTVI